MTLREHFEVYSQSDIIIGTYAGAAAYLSFISEVSHQAHLAGTSQARAGSTMQRLYASRKRCVAVLCPMQPYMLEGPVVLGFWQGKCFAASGNACMQLLWHSIHGAVLCWSLFSQPLPTHICPERTLSLSVAEAVTCLCREPCTSTTASISMTPDATMQPCRCWMTCHCQRLSSASAPRADMPCSPKWRCGLDALSQHELTCACMLHTVVHGVCCCHSARGAARWSRQSHGCHRRLHGC